MAQSADDSNEKGNEAEEREAAKAMQKRFNEIQYDYVQTLQGVQEGAAKKLSTAQREYERTVQDAHLKAQKAAVEIQQKFLQESGETSAQEASESQQARAFHNFMREMNQPAVTAQESCVAAYDTYLQAVLDIQVQAKEDSEGAYREYIRAMTEWWAESDAELIDASSLAAIGQTLTAAATHTLGVLGQTRA